MGVSEGSCIDTCEFWVFHLKTQPKYWEPSMRNHYLIDQGVPHVVFIFLLSLLDEVLSHFRGKLSLPFQRQPSNTAVIASSGVNTRPATGPAAAQGAAVISVEETEEDEDEDEEERQPKPLKRHK